MVVAVCIVWLLILWAQLWVDACSLYHWIVLVHILCDTPLSWQNESQDHFLLRSHLWLPEVSKHFDDLDGFRNSWGELDNSLVLYLMRLLVDEYRLRVAIVFSDGRLHAVRYVRWHFKMKQYKRVQEVSAIGGAVFCIQWRQEGGKCWRDWNENISNRMNGDVERICEHKVSRLWRLRKCSYW